MDGEQSNLSENPGENQKPPEFDRKVKDVLVEISTLNIEELKKNCGTLQNAEERLEKCRDYLKHHDEHLSKWECGQLGGLIKDLQSVIRKLKKTEPQREEEILEYPSKELATKAFKDKFIETEDLAAFINHLEVQRKEYLRKRKNRAPYFPVIQSSGYGKSRLMIGLMEGPQEPAETTEEKGPPIPDRETLKDGPNTNTLKQLSEEYAVLYWSFASEGAIPQGNVRIESVKTFEQHNRNLLQAAFRSAITSSIVDLITSNAQEQRNYEVAPVKDQPATSIGDLAKGLEAFPKKVIFAVDEASNLLNDKTKGGISFFRCLRSAMIDFGSCATKLFFVVMATYSTISELSPGTAQDPSNKFDPVDPKDLRGPLEPFLLFASFGLRNKKSDIMATKIEECHKPSFLYSMGRPLWYAYQKNGLDPPGLLEFALRKLLMHQSGKEPQASDLTEVQLLALLGARFCITISSISTYAQELVAGHLARSEAISDDRKSVIISYPSEPILALASRDYRNRHKNAGSCLLAALRKFLMHGAVTKGHRGELIVRFLNLWAIDKAMYENKCAGGVTEIKLMDFLGVFSRKSAPLFTKNLFNSDNMFDEIKESRVCFTHFIYLSNSPKARITQDLLRYAYRRTAALVANEGREGIDWIIPLRLGGTNKEEFIGLVGQDKNRVADTFEQLAKGDNPVTHVKLHPKTFLKEDERVTFPLRWQEIQWPSMLFAVDAKESAVGLAEIPRRMATRSQSQSRSTKSGVEAPTKKKRSQSAVRSARGGTKRKLECTEQISFSDKGIPCIVLTGLDYNFLDPEEQEHLVKFRDCHSGISDGSVKYTPLTYDTPGSVRKENVDRWC